MGRVSGLGSADTQKCLEPMGLTRSCRFARWLAFCLLALLARQGAWGQDIPLMREAFSREVTVSVGGALNPEYGRIASREVG